jgi:hypothetical protein
LQPMNKLRITCTIVFSDSNWQRHSVPNEGTTAGP